MWKKTVEIQRCPLICPSNTDLAIVFFLTQEIKLVIIYCHDVMVTMITYLLAVQGALLPACVCMNWVLTVTTEWRRMWLWWQLYRECLCYCCNIECLFSFFSFFLSMRDSCVCACVLAFEHWSSPVREVNRCKSDSLHLRERLCVCVHIFACLTGCCDS